MRRDALRSPRCSRLPLVALLSLAATAAATGCARCSGAPLPALDAALDSAPTGDASLGETERTPVLVTVNLHPDTPGVTVPKDLLGLSIEYGKSARNAFGHALTRPNRAFLRLVANLPRSVIRIGGNSTDESCFEDFPVPTRAGCLVKVTGSDLDVIAMAATETRFRLLMGVNLAEDSPAYGVAFAKEIAKRVPPELLYGFEIGNEPDYYPTHTFYTPDGGPPVTVRPKGYDAKASAREYVAYADALRADPITKGVALAGPALAARWHNELATDYLAAVGPKRIDLVTTHHYPLSACRADLKETDPRFPSLANLLTPKVMERLASAMTQDLAAARSIGKPLAIGETNSVSCRGEEGVSDTLASAAWGVDYFFTAASLGVARLNLHGASETARYSPITPREVFGPNGHTYENTVHPLYYAMLLFAYAEGGSLLPVTVEGGHGHVTAWAVVPSCATADVEDAGARTEDADCPAARVFVVNKDAREGTTVTVKLDGAPFAAEVIELAGSSLAATLATLGGHVADETTGEMPTPEPRPVPPDASGAFAVSLHGVAAAMVSFQRAPGEGESRAKQFARPGVTP